MQNLMPQLNLPNKTIQQQPKSSRSSERSGKNGNQEDDFRNLLENSSKDSTLKKDEIVSKPDVPEKNTVKTQNSQTKKDDIVDEEVLQDVGMQALQLLMMGASQLEDQQIVSGQTDSLEQLQPVAEDSLEISSLQDTTVDVLENKGVETVEISAQDLAGEAIRSDQVKDPGTVEVPAADHKDGAGVQQHQVGETKKGKDTGADNKSAKEKMPSVQSKAEGGSQEKSRKAVDTVQPPKYTGEEVEPDHQDTQVYTAGSTFQQRFFQDQLQEMTGTVPTVHIQAADPQELMEQLLDQLKAKASLGDQEFEIQLHPENLGKLAIKVAYTAEKVSISIVCSNERTMELLSSGAKNIAQIMEENLGAPTTVMVDQEESDYLEQHNNQENPRQQQQESEKQKKKTLEDEHQDFLHQLRLGLI